MKFLEINRSIREFREGKEESKGGMYSMIVFGIEISWGMWRERKQWRERMGERVKEKEMEGI